MNAVETRETCLVRFIQNAVDKIGSIRGLARLMDVDHQKLHYYLDETKAGKMREFMAFLIRLRRVTGKSWERFGRELDAEFLPEEKTKTKK